MGVVVGPGLVLTAAHVVAGARVVKVRLDVGQPTEVDVQAEGWWADPEGSNGTNLAVVMIAREATAGRDIELARWGRIGDGMAVLAVQAFGFPRFKLRASPANEGEPGVFRDLEQVTGHAPVAANRRQGTLAVYLDDPAPAAPEAGAPSPWAGMSGAAVWAAGRIVGVVAEHHPGEGTAGSPPGASTGPTTSCQGPTSAGSCNGSGSPQLSAGCLMSSRPEPGR